MAKNRATIYLRDRIWEVLGKVPDQGLSQRITAMLVRYEKICKSAMPEFTRAEWCAIMDANNGGSDVWLADMEDYASGTGVWANVHDSIGLAQKWEIDQGQLVAKLQKLSPAELLAVDEAVARFWNHTDLETGEALKASWCKIKEGGK